MNIAELKYPRQDKIMSVGIANGQGESLVRFFMSSFAKSATSDRNSGEQRAGWFISNALFAEVAKKRFRDCSKGREKENLSGQCSQWC